MIGCNQSIVIGYTPNTKYHVRTVYYVSVWTAEVSSLVTPLILSTMYGLCTM